MIDRPSESRITDLVYSEQTNKGRSENGFNVAPIYPNFSDHSWEFVRLKSTSPRLTT